MQNTKNKKGKGKLISTDAENQTADALKTRALSEGPEAFSRERMEAAETLEYNERIGDYTLVVRGGLGAFSIGTSARILKGKESIAHTFSVPSWVYQGKAAAIKEAKAWAKRELAAMSTTPR